MKNSIEISASAALLIERHYLLMREKILSLAADFDRLQRTAGDPILTHPRLTELQDCLTLILTQTPDRATQVQTHLSDPKGDPRTHP